MRNQLAIAVVFFIALTPGAAMAQGVATLPGIHDDAGTLRVQERVDELFEEGEYDRAYFIYRNELAPIGDKYAQYMLGFMHLTGKGAAEDPVAASAWFRLAAERNTPQFVAERDGLLASLDAAERARSDQLTRDLRLQLSDLAIAMRLLRQDQAQLRQRTGSRLPSGTRTLTIVDPGRAGSPPSGDVYYDRIEKRMATRLRFVSERAGIEIVDSRPETADLDDVDLQVRRYLEAVAE